MEGFYLTPGMSRAARNCNPGNIEWGKFAEDHGATGVEPDGHTYKGRFAVFPSADVGFAALKALLLGPVYRDLTVAQAINRYAPPSENNPTTYINDLCVWCGCRPTDTVVDVMTGAA